MHGGGTWANLVAVSSTGNHIAYATSHFLYLMGPSDSIPIWTADLGTGIEVANLAMSRDGTHIMVTQAATTSNPDSLRCWGFSSTSNEPIWTLTVPYAITNGWAGLIFSADGTRAVATGRNHMYIVNPTSGAIFWDTVVFNTEHSAAISGDGGVVAIGTNNDGKVRCYAYDTGAQTYVLLWTYTFTGGTSNWGTATAISADGLTVVAGSLQFLAADPWNDGYIAVFNTNGGGSPLWLSSGFGDYISDIGLSDDGLTVAAASWGAFDHSRPNIRVYDKYDSAAFFTYTHPGSANDLAINSAGTRVLAGGKAVHDRAFGNGGRAYMFSADLEGGTVTGHVTLQGQTNCSGVTVEAVGGNRFAATNAAGDYQIHHIPAGTYAIRAHKLGYTSGASTGIVVVDGGLNANVNFALDSVGTTPTGLTASQGLLRYVQLTWNPATLQGRRNREYDRLVDAGLAVPRNPLGPVAAIRRGLADDPLRTWSSAVRSSLDDLDDADSVRIWRAPTSGGPYTPVASVAGTAISYRDSVLVFPTFNYYYVISAVYANGESRYSGQATGSLDASYLNYNPQVPASIAQVVVDGVINGAEWNDAVRVDMSDVFGTDQPDPPGTAYLYLKYDNSTQSLLVAVEDHAETALQEGDAFSIYTDDDDSHSWSLDLPGSEGNYWCYYYASGTQMIYRSLCGGEWSGYTGFPYYYFPNPQLAFSASAGYLTAEAVIPLGFHQGYELALYGPNKIAGLAAYVRRQNNDGSLVYHGWWPQNVPSVVSNPDLFAQVHIPARLFVPPAPPSNIQITRDGTSLHLTWTDPVHGVDNLPMDNPTGTNLNGINVYRNGDYLITVNVGVQQLTDPELAFGGWYEYSLAGFAPDVQDSIEGPKSAPVGAYAGGEPEIFSLIYDDGTWEQFTYVDTSRQSRMVELCDMPPNLRSGLYHRIGDQLEIAHRDRSCRRHRRGAGRAACRALLHSVSRRATAVHVPFSRTRSTLH